ncbi:YhgE/Pip domain-containing protein [uncultured Bifidobacterium sp.]|uniref:YhgE/Pip domain-containing protein n=1 Tax=uncultured Bifidobacterium sp. TaxID=165187 RepID=UPI0028DB02C4|nr:YhgE/Pip domain-containing protein [uncultured Bifidobacterium sp.]
MRTIARIFADDMRRITGTIVSVIIVIGLVVIPGLFTWFNVAASWDPFSNTGNLKFAVANTDEGYKSDLIPVRITMGDQVVDDLRANSQLDWTFTSKADAIEGTKSGKYYAAVIIPRNFSRHMMTFLSDDATNAQLTYYTNEKLNALAPKVTGQGADEIAAQINETLAKTLASTALSVASDLSTQLSKPQAKQWLTSFASNVSDVAGQLTDASSNVASYASVVSGSMSLISSSRALLAQTTSDAATAKKDISSTVSGVTDVASAVKASVSALSTALDGSATSISSVASAVDDTYSKASSTASASSASLRSQASLVNDQISDYTSIRDDVKALADQTASGSAAATTLNRAATRLTTVITRLTAVRDALTSAATNIDSTASDVSTTHTQVSSLASQASTAISAARKSLTGSLPAQVSDIADGIDRATSTLSSGTGQLDAALDTLDDDAGTAATDITKVHTVLTSTATLLSRTATTISDFVTRLDKALDGNDMATVRKILGNDPETLAATLAAPVTLTRTALYPVANFGSSMTPLYTFLPLWVGALLMAVTLKTTISRRRRVALGDPKPWQMFLGHFGVFAVIALLQSTFDCGGSLLFLRVQAVHPLLFMLTGWVSSLVYAFFIYTLVASFDNVGKAIGVIFLVVQISGSGAAYPLSVLPDFISVISPYLPVTHSVTALRAAIAGIYANDYWIALGRLLLFIPPMLLLGLLLRRPLARVNRAYVRAAEGTRLL